jgi:hypothetical protein
MNHMFHILGLQWLSSPLFQSIPHDIPITNGGFLKWCVPRVPRVPQIIQIIQIHVSNLMVLGIPHDFGNPLQNPTKTMVVVAEIL